MDRDRIPELRRDLADNLRKPNVVEVGDRTKLRRTFFGVDLLSTTGHSGAKVMYAAHELAELLDGTCGQWIDDETLECEYCGVELDPLWEYCPYCGRRKSITIGL